MGRVEGHRAEERDGYSGTGVNRFSQHPHASPSSAVMQMKKLPWSE